MMNTPVMMVAFLIFGGSGSITVPSQFKPSAGLMQVSTEETSLWTPSARILYLVSIKNLLLVTGSVNEEVTAIVAEGRAAITDISIATYPGSGLV